MRWSSRSLDSWSSCLFSPLKVSGEASPCETSSTLISALQPLIRKLSTEWCTSGLVSKYRWEKSTSGELSRLIRYIADWLDGCHHVQMRPRWDQMQRSNGDGSGDVASKYFMEEDLSRTSRAQCHLGLTYECFCVHNKVLSWNIATTITTVFFKNGNS